MPFRPGKSHGVALALRARSNRLGIRVLFTALPEHARHVEGVGAFMAMPVSVPQVADAVERLRKSYGDKLA